MSFNTILSNAQIFNNLAIRTTTPQTSVPVLMDQLEDTAIVLINTTDQAITISTQASFDGGVTWATIGNTVSVVAGGSVVANQFDSTLTGIKIFIGSMRFVATAAVAPTTGGLTGYLQGIGC
jgi:hypothetical protein